MKKMIIMFCLYICVAVLLPAQTSRGTSTMFVAIRTLNLRTSTGFFASTTSTLEYGHEVTVLQTSGDWMEISSVSNPGINGWAKSASLTPRRILPGDETSTVAREVALAGRGFNQEVENSYMESGELNFADVDRVEAQRVTVNQLRNFLVEGHLSQGLGPGE